MEITIRRIKQTSFGDKSTTVYSDKIKTVIDAPTSLSTGQRLTGLAPEEETKLEKELGLEKGTLKKTSKFWETYAIHIVGNQLKLNTDYPEDALKLAVLKANKSKVAETIKEWKTEKPNAQFYIHSEEEEAKVENVGYRHKRNAYKLFDTMSIDDMRDVLLFYGQSSKTLSNDAIESKLSKKIEESPKGFINIVEDPGFKMKLFIKKLVKHEILRERGSGFNHEGEHFAYSLDKAVEFLSDKDNNAVLLMLKQKLQDKEDVKKKK